MNGHTTSYITILLSRVAGGTWERWLGGDRSMNLSRSWGGALCVVVGPISTSLRLVPAVSVWCTISNIIVSLVRVIGGLLNNGGCLSACDLCIRLFYSL